MTPKAADNIENGEDPDQRTPRGAVSVSMHNYINQNKSYLTRIEIIDHKN